MRLCGRRYQCIDDWQVQYSDIRKKRRAAVMFTMRFSEWTWQNIIVRIVFSLVLGIVIGIDRGAKPRRRRTDNDHCLPWRRDGDVDGAISGSTLPRAVRYFENRSAGYQRCRFSGCRVDLGFWTPD